MPKKWQSWDEMMKIEFKDVSQSFHGRKIFGPIDGIWQGGKITAVTGCNGSGKSTFLKLAGHLLRPTQGQVLVLADGQALTGEALRQRLAVVTPELKFYDRLTARENLDFFLGLRGRQLTETAYAAVLARVGLAAAALGGTVMGELSTGMRQRLKLAVLLAMDADIWLLDEPGANLDENGRALLLREVKHAAAAGKLVLLATNDPGEEAMADVTIALGKH